MNLEQKKGMIIQAFLIDIFFTWYVCITIDRIILPALISYVPVQGFVIQLAYLFFAFISALMLRITQQSPGQSILSNAKVSMPFLGKHILWLAFSSSIVAGWITTDISPIDFFSTKGIEAASNIFTALITPELSIFDIALKALI